MESKMSPDRATRVPMQFRRCHSFMADPETTTQQETSPSVYRRGMIAGMAAAASGSISGCSLLGGDSNDGSDDSTSGTAGTGGTSGTGDSDGDGATIPRDGAEDLTVSPITTHPGELVLGLDDMPETPAGASTGEWRYADQLVNHEDDLTYFGDGPESPALQALNDMLYFDIETEETIFISASVTIFESSEAASTAFNAVQESTASIDESGPNSYEELEYGDASYFVMTLSESLLSGIIMMQLENIITGTQYYNQIDNMDEDLNRSETLNYHEMQLEKINNEIDI